MRTAQLFCAICASLCFRGHQGAFSESTKGFFITTGIEYDGVSPQDVIDKNNLLMRYDIISYPASGTAAAFECGRRCVDTDGCVSFLMEPSKRRCYVSRLDRCISMNNILSRRDGLIYYEVLDHAKTNSTETCFVKCLKQYPCQDCGRPHCSGNLCDECLSYCWDIQGGHNGSVTLWNNDLRRVKKTCYNQWEALWLPGESDIADASTPGFPVKLRVVLVYMSGKLESSTFESVKLTEGKLSVGNYTGGKAGNFWNAPFQERLRSFYPNSTCKAFFYEDLDSCDLNGEQDIVYKENGQVVKQGFMWNTGSDELDRQLLTQISLWILKV